MRWEKVNSMCIRSGQYRITKWGMGGWYIYIVYYGEDEIGTTEDANAARQIVKQHIEETKE